jgi:hypothetical protein
VPEWDGRRYKPKVRYESEAAAARRFGLADDNFDSRGQISYCPLAIDPDDSEVSYARACYAAWFGAMTALLLVSARIEFRAHEVSGLSSQAPAW